jgi:hypothetical protein
MASDARQKLLRELAETRASKATRVLSGACTLDEYKYLCGEIHGLDLAADSITAVLKKEEEDDE